MRTKRIAKIINGTVTKEQLIEALEDLPDGARVAFASDYGDHVHTKQIHLIEGSARLVQCEESGYSDSGLAIYERDEDDEEDEESEDENEQVWIIE